MTRKKHKILQIFGIVLLLLTITYILLPKPVLLQDVSFSQAVYDRHEHLLRLTLSADDKYRLHINIDDIAPQFIEALLLYEDNYFYYHPGVNPVSLIRAALKTYILGGRRYGASTITMQLARLKEDIHSSVITGKLKQIFLALQIERHYSKDEILEAYLNLAPYGRNIEGLGAAGLIYFGKLPDALTLQETFTLAVLPQNPNERMPTSDFEMKHELKAARNVILERWLSSHPEHKKQRALLEATTPAQQPEDLPFLAPHLCDATLAEDRHTPVIKTTLDLSLQNILERQAQGFIEEKRAIGLTNTSALIVHFPTMEVRALLGSVDFFNNEIQGQVNGTCAKRSPGSALKPLVYALAMEQGLIHPASLLRDAPMGVAGYNPENFDSKFMGPVTAREALIRSRNIPAIHLSAELSKPNLYEFLKLAGITGLRERDFYGLSLVLGGAEVTMEELAEFYAMFGNGGVLRQLRYRTETTLSKGQRLLCPEACALVIDILKDNPRPEQGFQSDWTSRNVPVAWKTGTSNGYRDAWAVGLVGPYVLAVWVGNFDGSSNPEFVGLRAAAPLFFRMVDAIAAHERDLVMPPIQPTPKITLIKVCSVSGCLPGLHCPHEIYTWFIPGKSPITTCTIHRKVKINVETGFRPCKDESGPFREEVFEFWPSDILALFRAAGIPRKAPPPYNPRCAGAEKAEEGLSPEIVSPHAGLVYSLRTVDGTPDPIPFLAITDADVRKVSWFLNQKYLATSSSDEPYFWEPKPGEFVVRVVDDQGRSDSQRLRVVLTK